MAKASEQSGKKRTPRSQNEKKTSGAALTAPSASGDYLRTMYSLPPRFQAQSNLEAELVVIIDTTTGKEVKVAVGAFGEVKRVLGYFFGGNEEESSTFVPDGKGGTVIPDQGASEAEAAEEIPSPSPRKTSAKKPSAPKKPAAPKKTAAAKKNDTPKKTTSKAKTATVPSGWEPEYSFPEQNVTFKFAVSDDGANGYDVEYKGKSVAYLKFDAAEGKFSLTHHDGSIEATTHKNVIGAFSRVAVAYSD